MADTKVSAFTAASALGGTETVGGVQSSANAKITIDQIKTYCNTMVNTGLFFWPTPIVISGFVSQSGAATSVTFDSNTDRLAYVGRSGYNDSITKIYVRTGTVTTGDTIQIQVETVTNGRPSGTAWNLNGTGAAPNGTVAIADTDDNVWKTVTLTNAAVLLPGDEFAIVVTHSSGATPNQLFAGAPLQSVGFSGQYPVLLQDTGAGSWTVLNGASTTIGAWEWIVEMTSAGVVPINGMLPSDGAFTLTGYTSGTSPDERALKFTAPFKCRCIGARVLVQNVAAGGDFSVSLWPASSSVDGDALAQVSQDGDAAISTTSDGYWDIYWNNAVTLTSGTVYYLGIRADTANSITLQEASVPSGITDAIDAFPIPSGGTVHGDTRTWTTGTAGAWSNAAGDLLRLPAISLIIDQVIG